jgi:glyoxalase family protein
MPASVTGLHHVTAIAGDAQQNLDFYCGVLGLRLVKRTVNFDDPGTWHLYYGDELGRPGTLLTFFPWAGAPRGREGAGEVAEIALSVPAGSLGAWIERLESHGVQVSRPVTRFEDEAIAFADPDGMKLELVASAAVAAIAPWADGPLPEALAVRGLHSVALRVREPERSVTFLTEALGFHRKPPTQDRVRLETGTSGPGTVVDVFTGPAPAHASLGRGSIHHVAFRTSDDAEQLVWRDVLEQSGAAVTPVQDRQYFHSIYFREPGNVLFEIATDSPGFTFDETPEQLGTTLRLPPWLEPERSRIENTLPRLRAPLPAQS